MQEIRQVAYGATIWMGRRDDQDDEIGGRDLAKMDCESVRCKGGIF